jgi:hypothetical protein
VARRKLLDYVATGLSRLGNSSRKRSALAVQTTEVRDETRVLCALSAVAFSFSSFALTAAVAAGDQSAEAARTERIQHWAADHEMMMDARLDGMKAALKLR